ncbi:YdcF family protein [Floccifex sp.]|uniref:YdcF family protein n=1 Tax=Floccifex sp. TaxID=2815810 RepID=UPI003F0F2D30
MIVISFILAGILILYFLYFPPIPRRKKVYDYAIVLGCPNRKDGSLCTSQIKRCELAMQAYQKGYYKTMVITGGANRNHYIESIEMNKYIQDRMAIPYILETKSKNTFENFEYSHELIKDASVLVISSQTHIKRACAICRKYFKDYSGIYYPEHRIKHITREFFARWIYIGNDLKKKSEKISLKK